MHMRWMALVGALMMTGAGCATQRAAVEKTAANLLISDEEEARIGKEVKAELEQKQKIRYVQDPEVLAYVNKVATPVLRAANRDRKVSWKVNVIDDPKTVNAFATPGGYLYVYTGLLLAASNDAELAGVMGHEAAHVTQRHSARQMVSAFGLQAVTQLALGKNPGLASKIAAGLAGQGLLLAHSRSDEEEADAAGAVYTNAAGYDPRGLATFFQKLQKQSGDLPPVLTFLSTHPNPGDRVKEVNRLIKEKRLNATGGRDSAQLQAIQQRVKGLGSAK
jgi:predicted Zn-dependent protease